MSTKRTIIAHVWEKAVGTPFSLTELVRILSEDCGYDMHCLSQEEDLAALIEDRFVGDWDRVASLFGEFAYALNAWVERGEHDPKTLVCWVVWVLITGEISRQGSRDWDELGFFLDGLHVLGGQLDNIPAILGEAFRGA